jgi:hypothetical protein
MWCRRAGVKHAHWVTRRTTKRCRAAITEADIRPTRKGTEAERENQEIAQPFPSVGGGARPNLFWKEATGDGVYSTRNRSQRGMAQVIFFILATTAHVS